VILERFDSGRWHQVSSEMAQIEIDALEDVDRQRRIAALIPADSAIVELDEAIFERANNLERFGFDAADAVHVAAAEASDVDVLLSCDDSLCRVASRHRAKLRVKVANPLTWLKEQTDASNTG
jgi:predicted nucleic acid-binding protein